MCVEKRLKSDCLRTERREHRLESQTEVYKSSKSYSIVYALVFCDEFDPATLIHLWPMHSHLVRGHCRKSEHRTTEEGVKSEYIDTQT